MQRAFDIVERFVDHYCATSFNCFSREDSGGDLYNRKDNGVAEAMDKYYAQTKRILVENRAFLDAVAEALLAKKTLVASDIQQIHRSIA